MQANRHEDMIGRVTRALDGVVDAGLIPGWAAAVEQGGQRGVASGGWANLETRQPMTIETAMPIASLSKPVAAVLVLQLVRDGELGLDDPISRWLPEFSHPLVLRTRQSSIDDTIEAVRPITVRHLLTMTSGLGFPFGGSSVADEMVQLAGLPLQAQPGEGWFYHYSTDLLSVLLERVTGTALDRLVEERVARPLGLGVLGFHAPSGAVARGHSNSSGTLVGDDPEAFTKPPVFRSLGAACCRR